MNIESSIKWLKNHPVILIVSMIIIVVSSITTLVKAVKDSYQFYKTTIGYNAELDKKLNSLNIEVDIGYFNSVLGAPAIKNSRSTTHKFYSIKSIEEPGNLEGKEEELNYNEYFYINKYFYVQAVTDQNEGSSLQLTLEMRGHEK